MSEAIGMKSESKSFLKNFDFLRLTPRLGRIRHLGLFSFSLGLMVIGAFSNKIFSNHQYLANTVEALFISLSLINIIFLKIRRLNDFNFRGWWILLVLIPIIGTLWALAIFLIPGTRGNNRFGIQSLSPSRLDYFMILTTPLVYFILYLFGIYDLT